MSTNPHQRETDEIKEKLTATAQRLGLSSALFVLVSLLAQPATSTDPPADQAENPIQGQDAGSATTPSAGPSVSISIARDRAKLLHQVYVSTQDVMHRRYFHGGRATVPARAMEDVFSDIEDQTGAEAKWISITLEPMSLNHAPATEFEKRAARELKSGKSEFESIEAGYYRRAGAISLAGGCIHCHAGLVSRPPSRPVAGLVISIPVSDIPVSDIPVSDD